MSVGWLVCWSVSWFVRLSVGWMVCQLVAGAELAIIVSGCASLLERGVLGAGIFFENVLLNRAISGLFFSILL